MERRGRVIGVSMRQPGKPGGAQGLQRKLQPSRGGKSQVRETVKSGICSRPPRVPNILEHGGEHGVRIEAATAMIAFLGPRLALIR